MPCDLPIRLESASGILDASLVDVSRLGLRLRIAGDRLGVHRLSSLVQISRRLKEVIGESFGGQIDPEVLGPLLRKRLTTTRIAKRDWQHTDVEIGCTFEAALTDQEVDLLKVELPPLGEPLPGGEEREAPHRGAEERVPLHASDALEDGPVFGSPEPAALHALPGEGNGRDDAQEEVFQAFLYPEPGLPGRPLVTKTRSLSNGTAILEVEPLQQWELADMPVTELVAALDESYGTNVMLRIINDGSDLWAGPAVIEDVDVTPDPAGIRIGVTFRRQLRTEELGRLGLPTPA